MAMLFKAVAYQTNRNYVKWPPGAVGALASDGTIFVAAFIGLIFA
jgi:hypothetical protein